MRHSRTASIVALMVVFAVIFIKLRREKEAIPEGAPDATGVRAMQLTHDGIERNYVMYVPTTYDKTRTMPMIIALHGGGGNSLNSLKYYNLQSLADKEGIILAFPEGLGPDFAGNHYGRWNANETCCGDEKADDVGFISAMMDEIEKTWNVDTKRVYALGVSNGAMMSFRLACELSERIAAIAPSGGQEYVSTCKPTRAVPTFYTHGLEDPCEIYEGSETCGGCFSRFVNDIGIPMQPNDVHSCPSVETSLNAWATLSGCGMGTTIVYQKDGTTCKRYDGCDVEVCTIENHGHSWPGNPGYGIDSCTKAEYGRVCQAWIKNVGPLNTSFDANAIIWQFFSRYTLP